MPRKGGAGPSKLFWPLNGKPLLVRTLSAFQNLPEIGETIVAVPPAEESQIALLLDQHGLKKIKLVPGGKTRAESVWNALKKSNSKNSWVMVHDGARPFVSREALQHLFRKARGAEGAILAKKVVPTLKEGDAKERILRTVNRSALYEAETPQLVRRQALLKAYRENAEALQATDESSLLEPFKTDIKLVTHSGWNPKITTFKDWELAEAYLRKEEAPRLRMGWGRDTHRLVPGRKFWLGGVRIPFDKGPLGHSDGDALLHAVIDALLGAAGLGDIGEWFSDRNPKFKNMKSEKMLGIVLAEMKGHHLRVRQVDSVITLEKPKLGPLKQRIREKMAGLLGLRKEWVSVKAKTLEGLGPEGEGRAITCEALAVLEKGA